MECPRSKKIYYTSFLEFLSNIDVLQKKFNIVTKTENLRWKKANTNLTANVVSSIFSVHYNYITTQHIQHVCMWQRLTDVSYLQISSLPFPWNWRVGIGAGNSSLKETGGQTLSSVFGLRKSLNHNKLIRDCWCGIFEWVGVSFRFN